MKAKPDDRSDNAARIQENISNTINNINLANEVISESNDPCEVQNMKERNARREEALEHLVSELEEEAAFKKNNMK